MSGESNPPVAAAAQPNPFAGAHRGRKPKVETPTRTPDGRSLLSKPNGRAVKPANLDWRRQPDAKQQFIGEVNVDETFINNVLGSDDPLFWDADRNVSIRRVLDAKAKAGPKMGETTGDQPLTITPDWTAVGELKGASITKDIWSGWIKARQGEYKDLTTDDILEALEIGRFGEWANTLNVAGEKLASWWKAYKANGGKLKDSPSEPQKEQSSVVANLTSSNGVPSKIEPESAPKKAIVETPASEPVKAIEPNTDVVALTTVISSDGEIIAFDPNRALVRTKGTAALINRLVVDKVLIAGVDYGEIPGTDKPTLYKAGAEKLLTAFQLFDSFKEKEVVREWKQGFFFYEYECTLYDRETGKAIGSGIGSCNSMEKKYRYRWLTKDRVPKGLDLSTLPTKGGKISEPDFAIDKAETTGKYGRPLAYWQQFRDAISAGTATRADRKTKDGRPMIAWEMDMTMYGVPNDEISDLVNTISKMAQKRALVAAALNATGASSVFTQDLEDLTDFGMIELAS